MLSLIFICSCHIAYLHFHLVIITIIIIINIIIIFVNLYIKRFTDFFYGILMDGWMDDLRFYVLFNSVSVISGRWEVDNERLYAIELRLRLRRFRLERGSHSVC